MQVNTDSENDYAFMNAEEKEIKNRFCIPMHSHIKYININVHPQCVHKCQKNHKLNKINNPP